MSAIDLRADYVRLASLFTRRSTGNASSATYSEMLKHILVEPHPSGEGATIVSTDGSAMLVQHDKSGEVDRPCLLVDVRPGDVPILHGDDPDKRRVISKKGGLVLINGKRPTEIGEASYCDCNVAGIPTEKPGLSTYPNWRVATPKAGEIESMVEGFPGQLNAQYLSLIGRMYEDGFESARVTQFLHNPNGVFRNVYVRFPWREGMMLILAPMERAPGALSSGWAFALHDLVETAGQPAVRNNTDPAEGL